MPYCCEVFPKIARQMNWMINPTTARHPFMWFGYTCIDINFCPSCGADIRGIVITKSEFDKLK